MAIQNLTYCNAALNQNVTAQYNDVTHALVGSSVNFNPCSGGLTAGTQIYSHIDGGDTWSVRVQNYAPYAFVVRIPIVPPCSVTFGSAAVGDSTTDEAADGSIVITASGSGTLTYSKNDGQSYQSSPTFTGLAPGTYNLKVKCVAGDGSICYATGTAVVGFTTLVCDLELGTINTTASPGGTIVVLTVNTVKPYAIEYRLDAGAWQDSPEFTGLAAGTYNVQARFKLYTGCGDSRNVDVSATPCDIILQTVVTTDETALFAEDGTITIFADSADTIEYSIDDGGSYQAGNEFTGLTPGDYIVRVKNTLAGCEASMVATVERYKAPYIEFPQTNPHRVVLLTGPTVVEGRQNMDNTLFNAMRYFGQDPGCYDQKWLDQKISRTQFRSSYEAHTAKVYTDANVLEDTLTPVKKTSYIGKTDSRTANFSDAGANEVQIWFTEGLPSFYQIGQPIVVTGLAAVNGNYTIKDIRVGVLAAVGNIVLIIDKIYTPGTDPVTATIAVVYDVEPWDVWELAIDWLAYGAGKYYITFEGTDDQFASFTARTEPVEVVEDDSDLVSIEFYNLDNAYKIDYSTGIEFLMYAEGEVLPDKPGGEREQMEDSRRKPLLLREHVTRIVRIEIEGVPPYLGEKIKLALGHDVVIINGVEYQKADDAELEYPDPHDPFCNVICRLRQVDFMTENSHDSGDVDANILELGDGDVMQVEP